MNLEIQQFKAEFFKALAHPLRKLLHVARQIFNNHLVDTISMLDKFNETDHALAEISREEK